MPDFENMGNHEQLYPLTGGAESSRIQLAVKFVPNYGHSLTIDDFELITVIGKGSFGK